MNKNILNYIEECEAWKVGIKNLHWSADNLSQHELCDDIADEISNFEDLVSEVEQSISGKIKLNGFTPKSYKITSLKSFVEDVISATQSFLKELEGMGEKYVGIKSECETFIGTMQRKLYLVNFTLKEELKKRLRDRINESRPKNLANTEDVEKFMGRRPKTIKARINQIYRIVKRYGIDSKLYHDDHWQAKDDYYRAITSLGCDFEMRPCGNSNNLDNWDDITSDGGYCDYAEDGMPRSKQYAVKIMYDDGMNIGGYIKFMAAGRVDDPFSSYDTCMILWPKNNRMLENKNMEYKLTESEVKELVREAATKIIREGFWDELSPEKKDFLRRGGGSNGEFALPSIDSLTPEEKAFLDGGVNILSKQMRLATIRDARKAGMSVRDYIDSGRGNVTEGINETPLDYDIDNFSGRWNKSEPSDEELALADSAANGDYLDNPFNPPNSWDDDEWIDGDKDMENDYSWDLYHRMNNVGKSPVDRQHDIMDAAQNRRDHAAYWTDRDNERGNRLMSKWVDGKRDLDDLEDADFSYDPYKYNESKNPMKVTEAELKQIVKEAAMQLINEYNQRMANTKGFIRSTHGHGDISKRRKKATPEERAEARRRLGIPEPEKVAEESIDIDPKNKGKFTATKKATGKSTEELTHSKNPLTRKRAIFAQNAKKWNHKK